MTKTKVTPEMIDALRDIIRHKIAMWDASTRLEELADVDIDTSGDVIDGLAAFCNDVDMIDADDVLSVLSESREWGPIKEGLSEDGESLDAIHQPE